MGIYISNISKPKEADSVLITFYDKYDIDLKTYIIKDINSLIELEEWNSYGHGKMYAPKGLFQKILDEERSE